MTQLMKSTDVAYEIGYRAMHLQPSISNIRFVFVSPLPASFLDHYVIILSS